MTSPWTSSFVASTPLTLFARPMTDGVSRDGDGGRTDVYVYPSRRRLLLLPIPIRFETAPTASERRRGARFETRADALERRARSSNPRASSSSPDLDAGRRGARAGAREVLRRSRIVTCVTRVRHQATRPTAARAPTTKKNNSDLRLRVTPRGTAGARHAAALGSIDRSTESRTSPRRRRAARTGRAREERRADASASERETTAS